MGKWEEASISEPMSRAARKGEAASLEARAGKHRATQTEQDTWTGARHLLPEGPAQVMRWDGWMDG
jgi:hypothetical protein